MSSTNRAIKTSLPGRSDRLIDLVYELLDAHADTQRLLRAFEPAALSIQAHLAYLCDLQRVGREILADVAWDAADHVNHPATHQR